MTLNLEQSEIEAILRILSKRPHNQVAQLMGRIIEQAQAQLAAPQTRSNGDARIPTLTEEGTQ